MSLESIHLNVARDFMKRKEYRQAFFHLLQVPREMGDKGFEELSKSISNNPKYQEMREVISEVKRDYSQRDR